VAEEPTWRAVFDDAATRLRDRSDARRLVEQASGMNLAEALDQPPTVRSMAQFDAMLERRAEGEPLQYVLGSWGFRSLDVHVDRRVLIPRPETEVVVERALEVIDVLGARTVVDMGTGSGVIALSIAMERTGVTVWASDVSADALDVTRANLAGIGRPGACVQVVHGDWFDALPRELLRGVDVIVANPPYVAESDVLPADVAEWEPRRALVAGPSGLESIEHILRGAPEWLASGGAVVLEIGETQGDRAEELARADFRTVEVHPDLAGRPRVLVARR
jgi:release factor glutamine methyltransferase